MIKENEYENKEFSFMLNGLMLGATVFNANSAVVASGASMRAGTSIVVESEVMDSASATIADSVTTNIMNSQSSVVVECS